jgi:hypothetical protein
MNIVGLGACGCTIAKRFEEYPQYSVKYIDTESHAEAKRSFVFPKYEKVEDYENNCPDLNKFFKKCDGELLFVVGGSGMISGASLRILEQVKKCKLSVLYVQPNRDFLFGEAALQERATFGIFQQYARSGLFERLYLVNNVSVEETMGDITVSDYFSKINEAIVSTLHMIHVWNHSTPVMGNLSKPSDIERITTLGVMDVDSGIEKLFFPLKTPTSKNILYAINNNSLKNEKDLLGRIQKQIKNKMNNDVKVSFGIYPTDYEGSQAYILTNTKIIQGEDT